jgi:hypothetical protein
VGGQIENTLNSSCSPTKSWPWSRGSFRGCIGSLPPGSGQPLLLSPQKDPWALEPWVNRWTARTQNCCQGVSSLAV